MTTGDTEYRDLLPVIIETTGSTLPDGFDSWGVKSVYPDLLTTHGFRWATPGGLNVSNDALDPENTRTRPSHPGDGLCVATSWAGMASGGIPARTLLLVAYRSVDVVGRDEDKLRIGGVVASVAFVDGERLVREHGQRANLQDADLRGSNLQGADLQNANFRGADLRGSNLRGADLRGADLRDADLQGADLQYADLRDADLQGADLQDANLRGANLQDVNLRGSNLQDANLRGANLRDADLRGADLRDADLRDADLQGADLQYADLQKANLQDANLRGANLQDADI